MLKIAASFGLCLLMAVPSAYGETILRTLEVKENASGLAYDGHNLWHGIYGASSDWLYKVDYDDGTVLDSIANPGSDCFGLAWDGSHLWVMCAYPEDSIYKIDTLGAIVTGFPALDDYHAGLAWDGTHLWNGRYYPDPGYLFRLNPSDGSALDTIPPPEDQTWGLAWDGSYLWVCDRWADTVCQVDTSGGAVVASFASPHTDPAGLAWDGSYLWLIDEGSGGVDFAYQIDPSGGGTPEVQLSSSSYDFPNVVVGDSSVWDLGITNVGGADLSVDSIVFDNTVFHANYALPDTLPPDATVWVPFVFQPTSPDTFVGTARVYSDDPTDPEEDVSLTGVGLAPGAEILVPVISHDYGDVRVGASSRWFCTVYNQGEDPLVIDSVVSDDGAFSCSDPTPIVIESTLRHDLSLWFSPPVGGSYGGLVTIHSTDPDEPQVVVSLSGYGDASSNPGGEILWYYHATDFDPSIKALRSIPDVNGDGIDDVVAGSENDTIYCFSGGSSGQANVLWTFVTSPLYREQELIGVPDLNGDGTGDVVVGTPWGGRSVIAISGIDGDTIWIYDTHEYGGGGWVYEVSETIDVDGDELPDILAAAGDDGSGTGPGRVFCLSGADGSKIWQKRLWTVGTNIAVFSVRAIDDFTGDGIPEVAAGSGDEESSLHRVWMLNGADGEIEWSEIVGDAVWSVVPIEDINGDGVKDVVAGIGVFSGSARAFDATDGDQLWNRPLDGGVEQVHIISDVNGDGFDDVLPSGLMSDFYCLDGLDGSVIWSTESGHMAFTQVPIPDVTGDLIDDVIGGSGYSYNRIYCFNGATGDTAWTHPGDGAVEVVHWMPSADRGTPDALTGSRNGEALCLSGGLTLFGAITGQVVDEADLLPIDSAVVTAQGHTDTTDANGDYLISLETGLYEVIAWADGYEPDTHYVGVMANDTFVVDFTLTPLYVPPQFIRADADGDSAVAMSDAVFTLKYLYVPGADVPGCMKSADADDTGEIAMSDAIFTLKHLYVPGSPDPSLPFPDCGNDVTVDSLSCNVHPCIGRGAARSPIEREASIR